MGTTTTDSRPRFLAGVSTSEDLIQISPALDQADLLGVANLSVTHKLIQRRDGPIFRHEGTKMRRSDSDNHKTLLAKNPTEKMDYFVSLCLLGEKSFRFPVACGLVGNEQGGKPWRPR